MTHPPLALALFLAATCAAAQTDAGSRVEEAERLERARISQTRAAAHARFAAEEARCYQLFAVNDCLADVRRVRRDLLADLRRQDLSINDAQRKRHGAEQLLRADTKTIQPP